MMELAGPSTVRGGPRFDPPAERRRDSENLGRRASFSGPINNVPMRRMDELPRDFSDRPPLRGPPFNEVGPRRIQYTPGTNVYLDPPA